MPNDHMSDFGSGVAPEGGRRNTSGATIPATIRAVCSAREPKVNDNSMAITNARRIANARYHSVLSFQVAMNPTCFMHYSNAFGEV
eukprot:CAMPEP_0169310008 /NCGR_PEP_ID=MMETSP1017-20121227/2727_1 /TAXON_ID=342587 /ORGANISM="Karlodinium micrum, Strain CCMP2283" /LENGTH=85 /DNA_ID=CAMNT_0009403595 /DNA_START=688 /DNA_END=945 /DNA_ORIENTATION=-